MPDWQDSNDFGGSDLQDHSERKLIKQAQGGSSEAFGELYLRYAQRVFRYLAVHLENDQDAEDLTEEVFVKAWQALPSYRERGFPFSAFLFRVAHNTMIDYFRSAPPTTTLEGQEISSGAQPGEILVGHLESQQLRQVLRQLSTDYRQVLVLRFINDLSPRETAQVMGRSTGAVRVLQHRALAVLRVLLSKSDFNE